MHQEIDTDKQSLRALVIEDMEDDVLLLSNELKRGGYLPVCSRVDTPEVLVQMLKREDWDIVFCDYSMPKMDGRQALGIVRQIDRDVPFIYVSGTIGEDVAVEAMRTGAQDYIMKGNLNRLTPAVQRELKEARVRKERRVAKKQLHFLTNYDPLTHLPNRILFLEHLKRRLKEAGKNRRQVVVAHLDLDRFKSVNDSLGYKAGDMLLEETARRLMRCVNVGDIVSRLAADEFAMAFIQPKSREEVIQLLNDVRTVLEKPYDIRGCKLHINGSIGVALFPYDASNAEDLLRNSDIATCRTKDEGGNGYRFYAREMAVQLEERLALERAMRKALYKGEFLLHFQPKLELQSNRIVGVEALVRWNRSSGMIPPDRFIPLAEETGMIVHLGEWVLRESCAQLRRWHDAGLNQLHVAVNVSAPQFRGGKLPALVKDTLEEYDLDPRYLEIEVTESGIVQDIETALTTLKELQESGVTVSLDDFGTGYSSFGYLKHFQADTLKIDQSFVKGIPDDPNSKVICSAVIAMAKKLKMNVVAEGVETREQCEFLRSEGCDYVQGFYLCRPMNGKQIEPVLQQQHIFRS